MLLVGGGRLLVGGGRAECCGWQTGEEMQRQLTGLRRHRLCEELSIF